MARDFFQRETGVAGKGRIHVFDFALLIGDENTEGNLLHDTSQTVSRCWSVVTTSRCGTLR